jgi:hypothetical protein
MAIAGVIGIAIGSRASALFAKQGLAKSLWWWIFFAAKVAFALATAYMASSLLVGEAVCKLIGKVYPVSVQLTVWLFLFFAVLILPVAIQDQRVRCRRCQRAFAHASRDWPVRIAFVGACRNGDDVPFGARRPVLH